MFDDLFVLGYNNYYHDGQAAYQRGEPRTSFTNDDERIVTAWIRGWDYAAEIAAKYGGIRQ